MPARRLLFCLTAVLAAGGPMAARADSPMTYLVSHGARNDPVAVLTWGLMIIALAVIFVTSVLLLLAIFRRRGAPAMDDPAGIPVEHPAGGLSWLYLGVGISTVVLLASAVWTFAVLARTAGLPSDPAVTVEITGHQWWWEARYLSDNPSRGFTTANELHIPVGRPVEVRLLGADVIHSFWVPALTGKTDVIPGLTNMTWLQADRAGVYRGQCTEYCGQQHARMAFLVVASPPEEFEAWWDHQLSGAPTPTTRAETQSQAAFIRKCGICHSVRGTPAGGILGPDLSHLMSRRTLAAGTLPNTPGHLAGWIADPQHVKPGSLMPQLDLSGAELTQVRNFLETLR